MKTFDLKNWMTDNRDQVISKFSELQSEEHYNGCALKQFMVEIFNGMSRNNPRSEKAAASLLPHVMGSVYVSNSNVANSHTKPYGQSNHAKQAAYFGQKTTEMLNSI